MKAVSAAFKTVWARKHGRKELLKVLYKRQYWNGSAKVYEAAWNTIEQRDVPPIRAINWKLDTSALNEFKSSNVTLRLEDLDRKWLPFSASPSLFAPDWTAELGYLPYGTKFQIQFGYVLDDGTSEYTALFTGMAEDFRYDGNDGTVEISVASNDRLLRDADSKEVSDAFTLEDCVPATGNGTITQFVTTSVGVGAVSVVQVNGVTMVQGTDYTLSNMGEKTGAIINFTVAPGNTQTVKSTGYKWKADHTIEALVGLLCDEAGIGSSDRTINAALFPGGVSSAKTIDVEADWAAGSGTNWDATSISGSLRRRWIPIDKFTDGDYTANPTWTIRYNESADTVSAATGALVVTVDGNPSDLHIDTPVDERDAYGSWEFTLRTNGNPGDTGSASNVNFIQYGSGTGGVGYRLKASLATGRWTLVRVTPAEEPMLDVGACDTASHTWRITRTSAGLFTLYRDGVSVGTFTDTAYTLTNYFGLRATYSQNGGTPMVTTLDSVYFAHAVLDPSVAVSDSDLEWESAEQDLAAAPISWGQLERTEALNGGTITYATKVSTTSGAGYDAYVNIAADGTISSALKRYLKIRVTFSTASGSYVSPLVEKLIARYATTTVLVAVADFTGRNPYQAISLLAKLCNYEWGFTGAGLFFFRSKTVTGDAVLELDQENAISDLTNYRPGFDQVINLVRVRYGDEDQYEAVYGSTEAAEAEPTSQTKYGVRSREESSSDFLLSNETVIALGRARIVYEANHLPKKTFTLACRMIPHLDLADIVSATYLNRQRDYNPSMSDPLSTWGDVSFGPSAAVLARDMRLKTVGISFIFPQSEKDGFRSNLDVQEILS